MPASYDESILTAHNLLFTTLTISLVLPKAILTYHGQSAAPTTLDLVYGLIITISYFWLDAYKSCAPAKAAWYFRRSFPSVLHDFWCGLHATMQLHIIRIREAEEGRRYRNDSFLLSFRREITAELPSDLPRQNLKKALLVGICYEECDNMETLVGSHQDVMDLRQVFINQHDYAPKDIVTMLDRPSLSTDDFIPTRHNILTQISRMVQGAIAGDHFIFHYSGHSQRLEYANSDKGDGVGRGTAIVACDGQPVVDAELKMYLVEPLPAGSNLTAILDTCHSESLLSLRHSHCHSVFTPSNSRGEVRTRRNGPRIHSKQRNPGDETDNLNIWGIPDGNSAVRRTSFDTGIVPHPLCPRSCITNGPDRARQRPTNALSISVNSLTERCDSSTQRDPCDGNCDTSFKPAEAAHVISFSACKDAQSAWDGPDGTSFTRDLIRILADDPRPSLRTLMIMLSARAHKRFFQGYSTCREPTPLLVGRSIKRSRSDSFLEDLHCMENFQDPQLSSNKPLVMDGTFML